MKYFLFLVFIFLSISMYAQEDTVTFTGNILDESHQPIFGAVVIFDNYDQIATSDEDGVFVIEDIPVGTYSIKISYIGYKTVSKTIEINENSTAQNTSFKFIMSESVEGLDEVHIAGKSHKRNVEERGFAVNLIETKEASFRNIQTNELLNTSVGVKIRQNGGLGSEVTYSLNGLSGSSIRIFIDGVPISSYGSSFSLNSIPTSMIKNIEVYKGVVPGYLSDDALGGAINIVLHKKATNSLNASVSYGSFNTTQSNFNGNYRFKNSGFTIKGSAFYNYSDNDYKVSGRSVVVTGIGGVQTPITARRFNDAYRSTGGIFQVGYTNVKWADQFLVGFTTSDDYKEVQHGAFMTITPYKDRFLESDALLANVIYQKKDLLTKGLNLNFNALYGARNRSINDTVAWAYSWNGERAIDFRGDEYQYTWGSQQEGGPTLAKIKRNVASVRTGLSFTINHHHKILFNHIYNRIDREDSDALKSVLENIFQGTRDLYKNIYAMTYEMSAFQERFKASVFGKHYRQKTTSTDPEIVEDSNGSDVVVDEVVSSKNNFEGYGFATSYAITPDFTLLTSAEKAIRLPNETEVFGNDGDNVVANSSIRPEISDNYNLGFRFGEFKINKHAFTISTNMFIRNIKDRIGLPIETSLNVDDELIVYVNQGNAKSKGIDAQLNYTYKNNFRFNFNISRFDLTTTTASGTEFEIPNTPFLTMNSGLSYSLKNVIQKESHLNLFYSIYFTDDFSYLTSQGANTVGDDFFEVPEQFVQDLGLSYVFPNKKLVVSLDVKNIFNRPVYDNLSVQKPGRAFYFKLNYSINNF